MVDSMTRVAVISTNNRVYGVNKPLELLDINPVKGKKVEYMKKEYQ